MASEMVKTHQYEPLRTPPNWDGEARQLVVQLSRILDDLYRRFNRLRFEDLGRTLRKRIEDGEGGLSEVLQTASELTATVGNLESGVASLSLTAGGIAAAVDSNRLSFSANGLEIRNAAGVTVFKQDNDMGNLEVSGNLAATSGAIGGFTIADSAIHNGTSIYFGADGFVRLGGLIATDDPDGGPTLRGRDRLTLSVAEADYLALGDGEVSARFPLRAHCGFHVEPGDVTANAPNAYIDPATGKLYRVVGNTASAFSGRLDVDRTLVAIGGAVTLVAGVTGGVAPLTYKFEVSRNGASYALIPGTGASRSYTPASVGRYRFRLTVSDSASCSDTAYSDVVRAEFSSALTAAVTSSKSSVRAAADVTWTTEINGGTGQFDTAMLLYKDGQVIQSGGGQKLTRRLTEPGQYWARAQVLDMTTGASVTATSEKVVFSEPVRYGVTMESNTAIRIGPDAASAEVARIPAAGAIVQIGGAAVNGWLAIAWQGFAGYTAANKIVTLG